MAERARILEILGAHLVLRSGCRRRTSRPAARPRRHLTRGGGPTSRCSPRRPRPASRSGARSSSPGGCGRATGAAPWLTVTGTNGKTTTVQMLASILRAAGLRACSAGNVGTPVLEAVHGPRALRRHRRRAVELPAALVALAAPRGRRRASTSPPTTSTGTARSTSTPRPRARSTPTPRSPASTTCRTSAPAGSSRRPRCRRGAARSASPSASPGCREVGVVDDVLADRAFVEQRRTAAAELATFDDLRGDAPSPAPHLVANALAAAALARAHGVPAAAVRAGLRAFVPEPHRIAEVGDGRRHPLGRRLQGHQPARRPGQPGRLRARRVGGRRPAQGGRRRRARRGCRRAAARRGAHRPRPGARSPRHSPDTRRMSPSSTSSAPTLVPWTWW